MVLVRHGQTAWNLSKKLQGQQDIPLTKEGREQAQRLSERLKDHNFEQIFSSDLSRAIHTAQEINKHHNLQVTIRKELRELSLGICEGMTREEIKQKYPDFYEKRKKDRYNTSYPEGESYATAKERIKPFLEELESKYENNNLLIVAHEGSNRTILGILLNLSDEELVSIKCPHDCIYRLDTKKQTVSYLDEIGERQGYLTRDEEKGI